MISQAWLKIERELLILTLRYGIRLIPGLPTWSNTFFSRWFPTCQPAWKNHDEYLKLRVQIQVFRLGITQIQKLMAQKRPGSPHEMAATLAKPHPHQTPHLSMEKCIPVSNLSPSHHKKRNNEPTSKNSGRKKKAREQVLRLGSVALRKNLARATQTRPGVYAPSR